MIFSNLNIQTFFLSIIFFSLSSFFIYRSYKKLNKIRKQFKGNTLNKIRNKKIKTNLLFSKKIILLVILVLLIIIILRPKWGIESEKRDANGIDIVFSLDISESMKAMDYSDNNKKINRLSTAKTMISDFVNKRPNDRFSLVVFAGEAFVNCPLTIDHNTFLTFLNSVNFDDISVGGTNLNEALKTSLGRFIQNDNEKIKRSKIIILITDGEDQNSNYQEVIEIAQKDKIQIFTIGLGSKNGSLIPIRKNVLGQVEYKKFKGELVKTSLDEKTLKEIAEKTKAKYFNPENTNDLMEIHSLIHKLTKSKINVNNEEIKKEQFTIFTIIIFLLWIFYLFIPDNI